MTTVTVRSARGLHLLRRVDDVDFRGLFVDELGWSNPDRGPLTHTVDGGTYTLTPVASFKGMRIWHCPVLPSRPTQRVLDGLVGADNAERLIIFTNATHQEWRWPRRGQTSGANATLMNHRHTVGDADPNILHRLEAIEIGMDEDPTLVELLARMRAAFDAESETAAVRAAELMARLYQHLDDAHVDEHNATLLLARLLFLLFADDTDMWQSQPDLFKDFVAHQTTATAIHTELTDLFRVLNTKDPASRPADSPFAVFKYVNGGLFADPIALPALPPGFRSDLLQACDFDWGAISPAVFGSMFQTVRDEDARRAGGEHYTTEKNILKTIRPLFLDELEERLDRAWGDKAQLTRFLNDLSKLRVMDPACGCGNFLIVAYRELRALELRARIQRRELDIRSGISTSGVSPFQRTLDVTLDSRIKLANFAGIEIDPWPARIAGTAMLLVDHLANKQLEEEIGDILPPLPISDAAVIHNRNALRIDWATVVPPSADVIIVGNPPFIGQYTKTADQSADTRAIWGSRWNGYLDYVTCWYAKALDYYGDLPGRWAFVSTNSICQGEATEFLWRPILEAGWRCRFAHRSFQWTTEARDGAAVHVSIVGFDRQTSPRPVLWEYPMGGRGEPTPVEADNINPYLCAAPDVLVSSRTLPLNPQVPRVIYGSKPTDGRNNLLVRDIDRAEVDADPIAAQYLRPFIGADELVNGTFRSCLWLGESTDVERRTSPVLRARISRVRTFRQNSTDKATQRAAERPHLFQYDRQPHTSYLAIPRHVGEQRRYFTPARYEAEVICGDANFMVPDPDGFALGVLSSSMFIAWMRAIGGRIKSDLRFSNTFTYNTFPLPHLTSTQRDAIVAGAAAVIAAREQFPGKNLATLYGPAMPEELANAHRQLDAAVDAVFGLTEPDVSERARQLRLFEAYGDLVQRPGR